MQRLAVHRLKTCGAKMKIRTPRQLFRSQISAVIVAVMFASVVSSAGAQGLNDIPWHSNVEQAKKVAQQQNKLVLLHFDASWCRPCKALETYVFRAAAVKKAIAENVVPVRLDADRELSLVNEYDVSMVPFDVIITPGGRVITERRSPADAENYAKMIAGTSTASRLLQKEKHGPIAHQGKAITNRTIQGQDPLSFRVKGPEVEEMGLSKDASMLQRRQTAFSKNKSLKKSNPWVNSGSGLDTALPEAKTDEVSVEDLERNQFLSKARDWAAPSNETRRAKPERIINERYFESIAQKPSPQKATPFALASSSKEVELEPANNDLDLGFGSNETAGAELTLPSISSGSGGDFPVQTASSTEAANPIIEVAVDSPDLVNLTPRQPVDPKTFCLKGKCPVTLITEGRWEDGDTRYGIVHRNRTYIFADADKLELFKTNPDKYSPVLAGYDPVVYHEKGVLVKGLVENGVFMGRMPEQKVVLFQDAQTRSKFQSSPKQYLQTIRQATQNASGVSVMR